MRQNNQKQTEFQETLSENRIDPFPPSIKCDDFLYGGGSRAPPSSRRGELNPTSANPSSPQQNHCAANKAGRQYITAAWQALAVMTLSAPLGLQGKARARDTLAYRGSNTWKYISGGDRGGDGRGGEGGGDDGGRRGPALFIRGGRRLEEMAFAAPPRLSVSNMDSAESSANLSLHRTHFRFTALQTSRL